MGTKKGREKHGLFVAEGLKTVGDLLAEGFEFEEIIDDICDVQQVTFQQTPQPALGVFRIKEWAMPEDVSGKLVLALDDVQDPGNLGTIIRIADWFGIEHIFCSKNTVDCWSPKVVQATMGSISRVAVHYVDLAAWLQSLPATTPIYGTLLNGENIYDETLTPDGVIVLGNEGKGISEKVERLVGHRLFIPTFCTSVHKPDSLNVAIATSIVCSEFRRRGK